MIVFFYLGKVMQMRGRATFARHNAKQRGEKIIQPIRFDQILSVAIFFDYMFCRATHYSIP
jgi:hypothetical protein